MPRKLISEVYRSNLFTMNAASVVDSRQLVPVIPGKVSASVAELRARLLLSECLETLEALGVRVKWIPTKPHSTPWFDSQLANLQFEVDVSRQDIVAAIDGACDTIYVATGVLVSLGVPDLPHMHLVCEANNGKFAGGAVVNAAGKYQKPAGWLPPDHAPLVVEHQLTVEQCSMAGKTAWWDDLGGIENVQSPGQVVLEKLAELPDIGKPVVDAGAEVYVTDYVQEGTTPSESMDVTATIKVTDSPATPSHAEAAKKRRSKPYID